MRLPLPSPNRSESLEPMPVNMRAMFLVGTGLWVAAGAVVGALLATGAATDSRWVGVCAMGAAVGLVGWLWSRWRRW